MKRNKSYKKNRRGIAIELTISAMVIMFAFGALVVSLFLIWNSDVERDAIRLTQKVELDGIGDEFISFGTLDVNELNAWAETVEDYSVTVTLHKDGTSCSMTVCDLEDPERIYLEVELAQIEGGIEITKWNHYHN